MVMDREMVRTTPPTNATTNGTQNGSGETISEKVNPQTVGREFVRQYYTLLHEAPNYLYRFYSNNSSFIHGTLNGDDSPITGQANIHQRISELNFRDCRAKILHVDAQSSVSDGVVIQVTGELSNNGEPMRRFMQTFVLVPLSTKNYYVHNDIFRYADEVYGDNVTNGGNPRGLPGTNGIDQGVQAEPIATAAIAPFAVPQATIPPMVVPMPVPLVISDPMLAGTVPLPPVTINPVVTVPSAHLVPLVAPTPAPAPAPAPPAHPVEPSPPVPQPPVVTPTQQPAPSSVKPEPPQITANATTVPVDNTPVPAPANDSPQKQAAAPQPTAPHANKQHSAGGRRGAQQQQQQQPANTQPQQVEPQKPKTWASLVHTGGSGNGTQKPVEAASEAVKPRAPAAAPATAVSAPASTPAPATATVTTTATTIATATTTTTTTTAATPATSTGAEKSQGESTWEMDSRQVFVGTIPSIVDETIMRERIAENYGIKVVDWKWLSHLERGFSCGLLLLDSDESAAKLIGLPRPHTLYDGVHVNFETKRDFRTPRSGAGAGPRRFQTSYGGAGRPPPNATGYAERERDYPDRDRRIPPRGGMRERGTGGGKRV